MDYDKNTLTALVFGATGFTGREVARIAAENGLRTVAHVRPDSPSLESWRARLEASGCEVDATPWETDALAETMSRLRPSIVFSLLGTTRARAKSAARAGKDPKAESYEAVDFGLPAMLLEAAKKAGTSPRFVFLSAAGAGGEGLSPYCKWKHKAEMAHISSGLPYTIARPSFIAGPGRDDKRPAELIGAKIIDAALSLAGAAGFKKLNARYRSNTNVILAEALVRLALSKEAENKIFESEDLR